jgi:hypothetical protein
MRESLLEHGGAVFVEDELAGLRRELVQDVVLERAGGKMWPSLRWWLPSVST